jgi:hypothetical protein
VAEYAAQSIAHAFIAALVTEALLRLWRVGDADLRVAFRVLPLVFPLAVLPVFLWLAPARGGEWFADHRAVFASTRWGDLGPSALRLDHVVLVVLAVLGAVLFVRDLAPFFSRQLPSRLPQRAVAASTLTAEASSIARAMGSAVTPRVVVLDSAAPLLLLRGARRATLVVSLGALARLDDDERRAALAHETAHATRRDPLLGWALMICRALTIFNPVCQVAARAVAREMEWRADDLAVRFTGRRLVLASALVKLYRAQERGESPVTPLGRLLARGRSAAVEARCRRLLVPAMPERVPLARVKLVSTGVALGILLFFVV